MLFPYNSGSSDSSSIFFSLYKDGKKIKELSDDPELLAIFLANESINGLND